jgi:PAS domain S-box-containing protein
LVLKASATAAVGAGVVLAVGEAVAGLPIMDPMLMIYTLAAGLMTVVTLLVKDKLTPQPATMPGKDLMEKIEKLAYGVDDDRQSSRDWRQDVAGRLDEMSAGFKAVESSVESLRVTVQHLADESPVPSWRSDSNGHCVWASEALRDLVGFSFEDGFQGVNWVNIFPPSEVSHVKSRWEDSVGSKNPFSLRTKYQHRDGTLIPVELHATCLPDGSFRGVARVVR